MPSVRVKDNEPFEMALRRFRRSCEKAGVFTEMRRREHYEKPTEIRKRKGAAARKRREVEERISLDDIQVMAVIEKLIKQSRESIEQYEKGGRPDLAAKERGEIALWQGKMRQHRHTV